MVASSNTQRFSAIVCREAYTLATKRLWGVFQHTPAHMRLHCEQVSTGASSDLQQATRIARMAVAECGMSEAIGPVYVERGDGARHPASADLHRRVDSEVSRVLREAHARVTALLARPVACEVNHGLGRKVLQRAVVQELRSSKARPRAARGPQARHCAAGAPWIKGIWFGLPRVLREAHARVTALLARPGSRVSGLACLECCAKPTPKLPCCWRALNLGCRVQPALSAAQGPCPCCRAAGPPPLMCPLLRVSGFRMREGDSVRVLCKKLARCSPRCWATAQQGMCTLMCVCARI